MPTFRSHPTKELTAGPTVPTGLTALTTATAFLSQVYISNPTAGALSILVTDTAGNAYISIAALPANSASSFNFPELIKMTGIKWQAGGAGLIGELQAYVSGI